MRLPKPVVIDCETWGINGRPQYPPVPCGVSILYPGQKPRYYAFGHADKNNATWTEARNAALKAYQHPDGILFQNAKFDIDVIETHFGLMPPEWNKIHDTMFLLFLYDPNQTELGLKPSAARLLGLSPEERDAVVDWLVQRQPVPGVKISPSKQSETYAMRYVPFAPGDLVGEYANGDVIRTWKLFEVLWPDIQKRKMLPAYDRERELMPILLEMERQGVPVDQRRLADDIQMYRGWYAAVTEWICRKLKRTPETLNLSSGDQLMTALIDAKLVDVKKVPKTKTGKYKTDKETLLSVVTDRVLLGMMKYRTQLGTCLQTFMEPWLATAQASGGLIFTTWNQVKSPKGDDNVGTRTGRLSSTPNFQNMPKEFVPIFAHEVKDPKKAARLPICPFAKLPPLPLCRSYIIPFNGHVLIDRDYCFSPDTEVLTQRGFVPFPALDPSDLVAQWHDGEVTYATPKEYQRTRFTGDLVHIQGTQSTDLLVTPNHQCLLLYENQLQSVRADEYPMGHYRQIHAGMHQGRFTLPKDAVKLLAAIQADATVKSSALAWKLKKIRKIARLHHILDALKIEYTLTTPPSTPGYSITYVNVDQLPPWISLLGDDYKTFSRQLVALAAPQRLEFLRELAWWDGRRGKTSAHWSYFTTHTQNADLIQELAIITGLRSILHTRQLPSGKDFTTVTMRLNYMTWTQTFTSTRVFYDGLVYCVTMPHGTVIVRRNGRVSVTLQSQQEPRILAHFDGGALMRKYVENPWIDFHDYARDELQKIGLFYDRKPVKNTNLGLIYGMGVGKLAAKNDMAVDEASKLKKAILVLYPGLKEMYADMKQRAVNNQPLRTWGGREYYCEKPKLVDGRMKEFDYKMVNSLIQGSAADCTKEAIIRFAKKKKPTWKLLLNVHDELVASVPIAELTPAMKVMQDAMEGVEFDVPMLSEGSTSMIHWDALQDYDVKGCQVCKD
jgi:DNA polymerase I-like protein with 3'-5' exonuclease and polymerase domains